MACPGYHYHRKAFLAYKRGRKTEDEKTGRKKDTGDEGKHRERDPTTAPTVPSPRVQPFPFVFFFPSVDQRTHQPLYLSISFSSLHLQV
jgi:hypothetical protein